MPAQIVFNALDGEVRLTLPVVDAYDEVVNQLRDKGWASVLRDDGHDGHRCTVNGATVAYVVEDTGYGRHHVAPPDAVGRLRSPAPPAAARG